MRVFSKLFVLIALAAFVITGCGDKAAPKKAAGEGNVKAKVEAAGFDMVDEAFVKKVVGNGVFSMERGILIDARPGRKFDSGHIPTSISIPDTKFDKFVGQLEEMGAKKDTLLVTYCGGFKCIKSYNDAVELQKLGYTNIKVYLAGMPDWKKKGNYLEITYKYAKKLFDHGKGTFIDARPARKAKKNTIPGAIIIPDRKFEQNKDKLSEDKNTLYVPFCGGFKCAKSHNVAKDLKALGYKKVFVYAGGMPEWKKMGAPTTAGGAKAKAPAKKAAAGGDIKAGMGEGTVDPAWFNANKDNFAEMGITIVDVRSAAEYESGHFKGAVNLDVNKLYTDGCESYISQLPQEGTIIFQCASGGRAGEAYFGLMEDCNYPKMDRLRFLDTGITCSGGSCKANQ